MKGSDVNRCHDGVGRQRSEEDSDNHWKVGCVLEVGGKGFDYGLEIGVDVG